MRFVKTALIIIGTAAAGLAIVGKVKKPGSIYKDVPEEKNPMEGKRVLFIEDLEEKENADGVHGHLESIGDSYHKPSFYEKYVKRCLDVFLSFICIRLSRQFRLHPLPENRLRTWVRAS